MCSPLYLASTELASASESRQPKNNLFLEQWHRKNAGVCGCPYLVTFRDFYTRLNVEFQNEASARSEKDKTQKGEEFDLRSYPLRLDRCPFRLTTPMASSCDSTKTQTE